MKTHKEKTSIEILKKQLEVFLKNNVHSEIRKRKKGYCVIKPWNDESLLFRFKPGYESELIIVLNNLILPARFTALYHVDTNTMECIHTILGTDDPEFSRRFKFTLEGKIYSCEFAESSGRLLALSEYFERTRRYTSTEYRNLVEFRDFMEYSAEAKREAFEEEYFQEMKPISFYVRGFKCFDEDEIIDVSKHLNFLMLYYDRNSPFIIIHSIERELPERPKQLELLEPTFPSNIISRRKDQFLLDLAFTGFKVVPRLQFLYYYQILEYSAFYYIDSEIKREILKVISTPDVVSNPDKYIPRIMDKVSESSQLEEAKIDRIVQIACDPNVIWEEVRQNRPYFLNGQEFDGGFAIDPFISEDITSDGFAAMWHPKTMKTLRNIRNALVHGRERRVSLIISPTRENDLKLMPWISIIRRIAEQVIIYSDVL